MAPIGFEAQVADPNVGMVVEQPEAPEVMVIAFGGLFGKMGMPPFECLHTISEVGGPATMRVFLRDLDQAWYLKGVRGVATTSLQLADALIRLAERAGVSRAVAMGTSSGGFGALKVAHIMGIDEVHGFVAQTSIDEVTRARIGDDRWRNRIAPLQEQHDDGTLDLRGLISDYCCERTVLHVGTDPVDNAHAHHVEDLPGVEVRRYDIGGGHCQLASELRDRGLLRPILEQALRPAS